MSFLDAANANSASLLSSPDRPSPLASQIESQTRDLDWTLAHFTFVANATTLAAECDIAHSPTMSVASCRALPTLGLAFAGESSDLLATYATFLASPGSAVSLFVSEEQRQVVESAFDVQSVEPNWQMLYRGDPGDLDTGSAAELVENDLSAAQALAKAERFELICLSDQLVGQGPAYGFWERRKLVAMGRTTLVLPGAAQIGNIVTRSDYRRHGHASAITAALLKEHLAQGRSVFVVVAQANSVAVALFDHLGFTRERPMYAMRCVLR
ncbi:MAG: GNAT family N-acetyltransferase [Anaerolineae bacterium]|nr:GNAT family N-acetyltransferase [Anaerolineae bacterium]